LTDLVTLAVGASRFAVEADVVREVVSLEGLAALPGTPDFVLGLLNVRGAIVAAIDLCPVLGVGKARADWPQVVVLRTASMEVGIAADACAMAHVTRSELRPVADNPEQPYVKATVEAGVEVLDIEKIIAATQHTLQSAAAREGA
jgi:purine-binding chemotaxis protein CheW